MARGKNNRSGLEKLLSAFNKQGKKRDLRDCRIGFAGGGPMLGAVKDAYSSLGLLNPPVWYQPDESKAKESAKIFPAGSTIPDFDEFRRSIDAVELFDVPGRTELAVALLKAGKHVSMQKPFARNLKDADEIIRAARRSGAFVRVNEYALFYEPYRKLKELIDSMEIGEVCAVRFRSNLAGKGGWGPVPELLKDDNYLFHPAFDKFALAIELLGDIESVCAYANPMRMRKGGQAVIGFKYKAPGRYGFFDLTYAPQTSIRTGGLPCDDQIEVAGTDGIIWVNHFHGKMTEEPWIDVRRGKKHYTLGIGSGMELEWEHCLRASAEHFVKSVSSGIRPRLLPRNARRALRFLLAAKEAADTGAEIKV